MSVVYTMGDMPIFVDTLNAVASVFNSSMFDPAQGGGIVQLGMLVTILIVILGAIFSGKISGMPIVLVILVFYAGVMSKGSIQIQDIYSDQVAIVDNVPYIIIIPATIAASISKSITDGIETSYTTVGSGSYLSLGAEGFVNPLKLLMTFRNPNYISKNFPYLSATLVEFVRYCAPTDPTFSISALRNNPDAIGYLAYLNVAGIMTYYSDANPNGIGMSCTDAASLLLPDSAALLAGQQMSDVIKQATAGNFTPTTNPSSVGATSAGIENAYNTITAGITANAQSAQQFMLNMVAATSINQGVSCMTQPVGSQLTNCMADVISIQAQEQNNVQAAGEATLYTKNAIPTMNVLLVMFYAFSPIVLAVVFVSGPHGLKVLAGYFMFGVWTQSWMPISAVLNYILQMQTQYAMSSFPNIGITLNNYPEFYTIVSSKIGTASAMLAATPVISMGLLMGSFAGLAAAAGRFSTGSGKVDATAASPNVVTNQSSVNNGHVLNKQNMFDMGQDSAKFGANNVSQTTPGTNAFDELSLSNQLAFRRSNLGAKAEEINKRISSIAGDMRRLGFSESDVQTFMSSKRADSSSSHSSERGVIHQLVAKLGSKYTSISDNAKAFEDALGAEGAIGFQALGSGGKVGLSGNLRNLVSARDMKALERDFGNQDSDAYKYITSAKEGFTKASVKDTSNQSTKQKTKDLTHQLQESFDDSNKVSYQISEMKDASVGLSAMKGMKSNAVAYQLANNLGPNGLNKSLAKVNLLANKAGIENFGELVKGKTDTYARQGVEGLNDEEKGKYQLAAGLEILSSNQNGAMGVISLLKEGNVISSDGNHLQGINPEAAKKSGNGTSSADFNSLNVEDIADLREKASSKTNEAKDQSVVIAGKTDPAGQSAENRSDNAKYLNDKEKGKIEADTNQQALKPKDIDSNMANSNVKAQDKRFEELKTQTGVGDKLHIYAEAAKTILTMAAGGKAGQLAMQGMKKLGPEAAALIKTINTKPTSGMSKEAQEALRVNQAAAHNAIGKQVLDNRKAELAATLGKKETAAMSEAQITALHAEKSAAKMELESLQSKGVLDKVMQMAGDKGTMLGGGVATQTLHAAEGRTSSQGKTTSENSNNSWMDKLDSRLDDVYKALHMNEADLSQLSASDFNVWDKAPETFQTKSYLKGKGK